MATPEIQPNPKNRVSRDSGCDDQISALPDGILAYMLLFLTITDAVKTSVLSNRWINVWKFGSNNEKSMCKAKGRVHANYKDWVKLKSLTDAAEAGIPRLIRLKKFTLVARMDSTIDECLLPYTSLIKVSLNLEKFKLKLECVKPCAFQERDSKKGVRWPLHHLKVVELEGYYGSTAEGELVKYFVVNAVFLERIVVDPCIHYKAKNSSKEKLDQIARDQATLQLQPLVPSSVKLIIL